MNSGITVAVVGSRGFTDYGLLCNTLDRELRDLPQPIRIITGDARGADALAVRYARNRGYQVDVLRADWNRYGKSAGPIRNRELVYKADCLIAFWNGHSRGTANSIEIAKYREIPVKLIQI